MPHIHQTLIADIVGRLPQLEPWNESDAEGTINLLIVCAGFEERSLAIVEAIKNVTVEQMIIIEYPTNMEDNAKTMKRLMEVNALSCSVIKYSRGSFLSDMMREVGKCTIQQSNIVVDVSAMASYVTSRVLRAVWDKCEHSFVRIFYAEAATYHPTKADWNKFFSSVPEPDDNLSIAACYEETYFQSRGVDETYECDVFPGRNQGPLATELVILPSFSLQRVKSMTTFAELRYNVVAKQMNWFLGSPPDKGRNGWRFDAIARLYNVHSGGVAVDTRDYRDIVRKLDETWNEALKNERHLVIGGMGSKMQNVGVFLFLSMHPECGLLHCEPKEFIASRYTEGSGTKWSLNLGKVSDIKELLLSRGKLDFRW